MTEIRKTHPEELDRVMEIYASAQSFMVSSGNPNQWKVGYPKKETIEEDIRAGRHYVCVIDGKIECVFMYYEEPDPTYSVIYGGAWPNDRPYGTIHRIASAGGIKRIADSCISYCFSLCKNLRIDTHKDNKVMQAVLARNGFRYCGIIHLLNGDERLAFQKTE